MYVFFIWSKKQARAILTTYNYFLKGLLYVPKKTIPAPNLIRATHPRWWRSRIIDYGLAT